MGQGESFSLKAKKLKNAEMLILKPILRRRFEKVINALQTGNYKNSEGSETALYFNWSPSACKLSKLFLTM